MQALIRGAPHGGVVVSPLPKQRIMTMKPYSNLIRFSSSPFKISNTRSLPLSRLRVSSSLKLIPSAAKHNSSTLMITEITSLIPYQIRLFLKVIIAFGLFIGVLEQIHKLNCWNFLYVNDLITAEVDGSEIFGFVEKKGWSGLTIKTKNGDRVFISKEKSNGVITKFDHQMKNGEHVNWRFTMELEIELDQVERIKKEIYKILKEDRDLVQEDAFAVVLRYDFVNRTAVLLVSCFTKTTTHEDYFAIRDALLLKLRKLILTTRSTAELRLPSHNHQDQVKAVAPLHS